MFGKTKVVSFTTYQEQVDTVVEQIRNADAILVGAAAGMSASDPGRGGGRYVGLLRVRFLLQQ